MKRDYELAVDDRIEKSYQQVADCIKIRNLGYRLSDDDYERFEQRLKEIKKYEEV